MPELPFLRGELRQIKLDNEDGTQVYEVEFYNGGTEI